MKKHWSETVLKPIKINARVKLKTRWRRGANGTVIERLDNDISGYARYGVRLDEMGCIVDVRRFEVSKIGR